MKLMTLPVLSKSPGIISLKRLSPVSYMCHRSSIHFKFPLGTIINDDASVGIAISRDSDGVPIFPDINLDESSPKGTRSTLQKFFEAIWGK